MRLLANDSVESPRSFGIFTGILVGGVVFTAADLVRVDPALHTRSAIVIIVTCSLMILVVSMYNWWKYSTVHQVAKAYEDTVQEELRAIMFELATDTEAIENPVGFLSNRARHLSLKGATVVDYVESDVQYHARTALVDELIGLALDVAITRDEGWVHLNTLPRHMTYVRVRARAYRLNEMTRPKGQFGGSELLRVVLNDPPKR